MLPEKYSIISDIEKDENNFEQYEILMNIKNSDSIVDPLAIPSIEEIAKMESFTADEMADMMREYNGLNFKVTKDFQKELDSVVHPSDEYSSLDAHHQPHFLQAEDLEHSIREMFQEYQMKYYRPDKHEYNPIDKDSSIYNMLTFHEFEGCMKIDTFMFRMLAYYSMLYRIFKLEYFTSKATSK